MKVKPHHDRDGVALGFDIDCGCGEHLFVATDDLDADAKLAIKRTPEHKAT